MTVDALWYLARGSGAVALVLFTLVVLLGVGNRAGRRFAGLSPLVVASVHRSASLLALAFLVVHVVALYFDPYAQLRLVDLVLPFGSAYRPLWVGLGALALDLTIALLVSSLLRERIGRNAWRVVHWLAYAMWPMALLHGIMSGSDRGTSWMIGLDIACGAMVLGALAWRRRPAPALVRPRAPRPGGRRAERAERNERTARTERVAR